MKLSIHQKLNYLGCCGMILLGIILYEINYSNQLFIGFAIGFMAFILYKVFKTSVMNNND